VGVEPQAARDEDIGLDPVVIATTRGVEGVVELDLDLVIVVDTESAVDQLFWIEMRDAAILQQGTSSPLELDQETVGRAGHAAIGIGIDPIAELVGEGQE